MLDSALYIKMKPIAEAFEDKQEWNMDEEIPDSARANAKRKKMFRQSRKIIFKVKEIAKLQS